MLHRKTCKSVSARQVDVQINNLAYETSQTFSSGGSVGSAAVARHRYLRWEECPLEPTCPHFPPTHLIRRSAHQVTDGLWIGGIAVRAGIEQRRRLEQIFPLLYAALRHHDSGPRSPEARLTANSENVVQGANVVGVPVCYRKYACPLNSVVDDGRKKTSETFSRLRCATLAIPQPALAGAGSDRPGSEQGGRLRPSVWPTTTCQLEGDHPWPRPQTALLLAVRSEPLTHPDAPGMVSTGVETDTPFLEEDCGSNAGHTGADKRHTKVVQLDRLIRLKMERLMLLPQSVHRLRHRTRLLF